MSTTNLRVIGIDPGKTTGIVWGWEDGGRFKIKSFSEVEWRTGTGTSHVDLLRMGRLVNKWAGLDRVDPFLTVLVIEDFVAYGSKVHTGQKANSGFSPIFVTGWLLGWIAQSVGGFDALDVVFQGAGDAKRVVSDDRLRELGGWLVGNQHARDAYRHAELFCRKVPVCRTGIKRIDRAGRE